MMRTNSPISSFKEVLFGIEKQDLIAIGLIIITAFFLRIGPILIKALDHLELFYLPDSHGYETLAINLIKFQKFSSKKLPPYIPNMFRTPLYPIYLAIIFFITTGTKHPIFSCLGQAIISTLSIFLVVQFARHFFSRKIAFVTGILLAIEPIDIIFCSFLMSEILFSLFFIVTFISFTIYLDNFALNSLIVPGICLGLATLTRPISLYYIAILIFLIILNRATRSLKHSLLLFSIFFITLSPWILRNIIVFREASLCNIQKFSVNYYEIPAMEQYLKGIPINNARSSIEEDTFPNICNYVERIAKEPIEYIHLRLLWFARILFDLGDGIFLFKGTDNFIGVNAPPRSTISRLIKGEYDGIKQYMVKFSHTHSLIKSIFLKIFLVGYFLFLFIIYLFSIIGIINLFRKELFIALFFSLTLFYFLLIPGSVSSARFRINLIPIFMILATSGIFFLWERASIFFLRRENRKETNTYTDDIDFITFSKKNL
ncbi:MAG: ArnT family glycosyltransferase [bacterium]